MKKAKVSNNCELSSRAYRLGRIRAERISGTTASLAFYSDYFDDYEWSSERDGKYYEIHTNCKGEVTSVITSSCYHNLGEPDYDPYFGLPEYDAYDPFGNTEA